MIMATPTDWDNSMCIISRVLHMPQERLRAMDGAHKLTQPGSGQDRCQPSPEQPPEPCSCGGPPRLHPAFPKLSGPV